MPGEGQARTMKAFAGKSAAAGNGTDFNAESLLLSCALTRRPHRPVVEAGAADLECTTHQGNLELASVCLDSGVLHRDSLAKYSVAFFKKPRS